MKLVPSTEAQANVLRNFYPEGRLSPFIALIPGSEYFFWSRRFTHLYEDLSGFLYPLNLKMTQRLPIVQAVSKLIGINQDGFLIPKAFKFGVLPEGTFKDFGRSSQIIPLLDTLADTIPYTPVRFPPRDFRNNCLGFLAWDASQPPLDGCANLRNFMPCITVNYLQETGSLLQLVPTLQNDKIIFDGKEYKSFLPTFNYFEHPYFQQLITVLNEQKLLTIPLRFPLSELHKLIGFKNPSWAEVMPLEFFLEENPDLLANYVLIRTDDGKIVTWDEVMAAPKLRLEIEMENYWLWQEACKTTEALENINLYWEFGVEYPWLIDKRTNAIIPAFVVED